MELVALTQDASCIQVFFHKFYAAREAKKPAKAARPEAGDASDASDASDAEIGAALSSAPF